MNLRARTARLVEAFRPASPSSVFGVVNRGLATFVIVWQALWMLATPSFWPFTTDSRAVAIAVGITRITLVVMLYAHLRGSARARFTTKWVDVVALFVATVVVLSVTTQAAQPDWRPAATFAVLPAGLAGLLFSIRPAVVVILGVIVAEAVAIFSPFTGGVNSASDVLYPAFAAAAGVITVTGRHVLVRDARRTDTVLALTAAAEQERRTSGGVEQAIARRERLLHESVLNTLAAIERGGLTASPGLRARLVARCRESARTLRELLEQADSGGGDQPATGRLDRDLGGPLLDLYAAGVAVNLDCDALDDVPPHVYAAFRTASREALSNIGRHADARSVWLTARRIRHGGVMAVSVDIRDDGRGFDVGGANSRYGVPVAIQQSMTDVAGTATIDSTPGSGTTVALRWDNHVEPTSAPHGGATTSGFVIPILATFALFTVVSIVLSWSAYSAEPVMNLSALAIYLTLAALLGWRSTKGPLTWPVIAFVLAASPLVYVLEQAAIQDGTSEDWAAWASIAIASLFLVVAGAGPPWAWLAALCTWLLIQGDIVAELMSAGTAILVAGAVYGRSLRRNTAKLERSVAEQVAESSSLAVARDSMRRVQQRYAALRVSDALSLLTGIAEGRVDPDDPGVRSAAAVEERFVRTVLHVDPTADAVQALVTSLAVRARRRGVLLETDVVPAGDVTAKDVEPATPSLVAAVESAVSGEVARLTTRIEEHELAIRLLVPIESGERDAMESLPVPGMPLGPDEPRLLWEFMLPLSDEPS